VSPNPNGVSGAGEWASIVSSGLDSEKSSTAEKSAADALGASPIKGRRKMNDLIN